MTLSNNWFVEVKDVISKVFNVPLKNIRYTKTDNKAFKFSAKYRSIGDHLIVIRDKQDAQKFVDSNILKIKTQLILDGI